MSTEAVQITIAKAEKRIAELNIEWPFMSDDQQIEAGDEIEELEALIKRCRETVDA